jgi:hypothetical protein
MSDLALDLSNHSANPVKQTNKTTGTQKKGEHARYRIGAAAGRGTTDTDVTETHPPGAHEDVVASWTSWAKTIERDGSVEVELKLGRFKEPQDVVGDGCVLKCVYPPPPPHRTHTTTTNTIDTANTTAISVQYAQGMSE